MDLDTDAVDEVVLALLYLNLCEERRAWKSLNWGALNRLHEKRLIGNPVSHAKSVCLTDVGLRKGERVVLHPPRRSASRWRTRVITPSRYRWPGRAAMLRSSSGTGLPFRASQPAVPQ
ncbi:DUF6429 family protein [Cupriavidus sp. 8B]